MTSKGPTIDQRQVLKTARRDVPNGTNCNPKQALLQFFGKQYSKRGGLFANDVIQIDFREARWNALFELPLRNENKNNDEEKKMMQQLPEPQFKIE